jgi:hypothetical protein
MSRYKAPPRPAEGWAWEQPGFRFSIDWPPGFLPSNMEPGDLQAWQRSMTAAKSREQQLKNGHTGALPGLSKKSDLRIEMTRDQHVRRAREK